MASGIPTGLNDTQLLASQLKAHELVGVQSTASEIDNVVQMNIYPEKFGAIGDGVNDDAPSIQSALNSMVNGGILILSPTKVYRINSAIVIPYDNITISLYNSTLKLGISGVHMLVTKGYIDSTTRLKNISLFGGAIDATGYSGIGIQNFRAIFHKVDNLKITDCSLISSGGKYMITLADTTNTIVDNIYCSCASDAIHLMGKNYNTSISNIKGTSGDDMVAVTTLDVAAYDFERGAVDGLFIKNVYGTNSTRIVLLGNIEDSISNVKIENINQLGTGDCVSIGDGGYLANLPILGKVVMDGIYSSTGKILLRHSNMEDVVISNTNCKVYLSKDTNGTVSINRLSIKNSTNDVIAESYVQKMTNISLENITTARIALAGIIDNAILNNIKLTTVNNSLYLYGTINKIKLTNCSQKISYTGGDHNIRVAGTVNIMIFDNSYLENGGTNGSIVYLDTTTSIIRNLIFTNETIANQFKNIIQGLYSGSDDITIKILNSTFKNFKRIVEEGTSTSTYNVYFKNYIVDNALYEQFRLYGTQKLKLYGDIIYLNTGLIASDNTTNTDCFINDASVDISKINRTIKSRAYNTNSGLSCGVGYVVCNGTTWTNIATGLTY